MFLYDPPSIPPSQGGRLKADTFTVSLGSCTELMSSTKEIVLFVLSTITSVFDWSTLFKAKPLLIEYQPRSAEQDK